MLTLNGMGGLICIKQAHDGICRADVWSPGPRMFIGLIMIKRSLSRSVQAGVHQPCDPKHGSPGRKSYE